MKRPHQAYKGRGNGIGLDLGPVYIDAQGLCHVLVIFNGAKLKPQTRSAKPVNVKDPKEKEPQDDVIVVHILLEDQPQEIRRNIFNW